MKIGLNKARLISLMSIILVSCLLISVIIGCSPKTTPTVQPTASPTIKPSATATVQPTATPTVKPAVSEWNIPFIAPLTGMAAFLGDSGGWAADLAVGQINNSGGIRGVPIKLTKYDASLDAAQSVSTMVKVLGTNPLIIDGPMISETVNPTGNLAVEAGVPFIGGVQSVEARQKFKPWGCSVFPDVPSDCARAIVEWLRLNPDIKSVVLFYGPEAGAQVQQTEAIEAALKGLSVQSQRVEVPVEALDMNPIAIKALSLKCDGYFSALGPEQEAKLTKALYNRGLTEGRRINHGYVAMDPTFFEQAKGYTEGTYIFNWTNMDYKGAEWQALVEAFKAKNSGALPYSALIPWEYDAVYAIKTAFEKLNITGDPAKLKEEQIKIRDFLWNAKDLPGLQGKWSYTEGKKISPLYTFQIHNEKLEVVSTLAA